MKRFVAILFGFFLISLGHTVLAQTYPVKTVRILVGFAPGGGTDIMARALGAKLSESLKQQFVVDNRPGANGNLAAKLAADAPGDGHTILFMSVAHIMSKPVYSNLGYDIERAEIVGTSPEQTAAIFKADLAKYTKVAKEAGIRAD